MTRTTERIIAITIISILIGFIGWLQLGHSMKMRIVLTHVTETAFQIGYLTGREGKYPKYENVNAYRVEVISENENEYNLRVPTNDGYSLRIEKTIDPTKVTCFVQ